MRVSDRFLCLLGLSCGVMACSGSSGNFIIDDGRAPDSPPDAFACAQTGTVNATAPVDFSTGQASGAVRAGGTQLTVQTVVTSRSAPSVGFVIVQANNTGVFGTAAGEAGRFEQPPALGSYAMDSGDNLGFGIAFVNGITSNGDGTVTIRPTQVQLLDRALGGTVKIDMWTPAATPGGTTTIGATFTNATFRGFNLLADGNPDPAGNGCDITIQNFQFTGLSVKWQVAAFPVNVAPALTSQPQAFFGPQARRGVALFEMDR